MKRTLIVWSLAVLITLAAFVYQLLTGPTQPATGSINLNNRDYSFDLPRSHGGVGDCEIALAIDDAVVTGEIHYRRYPTEDHWSSEGFEREGSRLVARLPHQPPAGKLEYYITLADGQRSFSIAEKSPIVIRFKGDVPALVLIPHIAFMLAAMLISNVAGIFALIKDGRYKIYTYIAFALLTVGGMILGPVVQLFAFDALWTGVPFGWDLTDNKTLIAFVAFLVAVVGIRKGKRAYLTVAAAFIMLIVFSIPHSLFGSQLDYSSGTVTTG